MKNTVTEIKNTIGGRLNEAEEQISDLEDKVAENIQTEQRQEKKSKTMSLRGLWDNIKHTNIHITGVP